MLTYVNYAGLAPLHWRSYLQGLFAPELLGNVLLPRWFQRVQKLRETIAAWLGCQPHQVAFFPSTSIALTVAANSLPWQPGEKALYPAHDFPANVQPWQQLTRFGVESVGVEDWSLPWPEQTRMISISTVDYSTGIEQPWRQIVHQAHVKGIWTCVDAIQSAGIKPSWDPKIDFWCAGTQKWLVSGVGLSIAVLSDRVLETLKPPFPNWLGLKEPPLLESGMEETARGWEFGWVTPTALARLEASLAFFERKGWDTVSEEVKQRRDFLHERLLDIGWPVVSCPIRWSGIVSFAPGAEPAEQIVQDGYKRRIITAKRGPYVRLSPHCFTSQRQLRQVARWLEASYVSTRSTRLLATKSEGSR